MMEKKTSYSKKSLRFTFILSVAAILLITMVLFVVLEYVLVLSGIGEQEELERSEMYWIFAFGMASVVIGLCLAVLVGRLVLKPVDNLIDGMKRLSSGDFTARLEQKNNKYANNLSQNFNTLANELQNMEMLRSDFVNNFSHELKTPITSVKSLITLLKNTDLSDDKREKYISIIEDEMDRLASMTTNILNLSKVERKGIISDKKPFNVSEQIRNCVLLLEKKWTKKRLNLSCEFDEYEICASEDMLKQVWINLLDNAIKFANDNGDLDIKIVKDNFKVSVSISNSGSSIAESEYDKIFTKFYRVEDKDDNEGNGIGLSIVKHIVQLHRGDIKVESKNNVTTFTVDLPIK